MTDYGTELIVDPPSQELAIEGRRRPDSRIIYAGGTAGPRGATGAAAYFGVTVRLATTANVAIATALNVGDTIDGVTLADGDLVLVKSQTAPAENGIYIAGAVPARHPDFDTINELAGQMVTVQEGTANAETLWICTTNKGGTIGVSAVTFQQFTAVPPDGSITYIKMAAGVIRERLTANRTYYVRADGVDTNTGLVNDAGGAFLTLQKAINVVAALDISIYNVTIQVGDGTYTAGCTVNSPWVGSGTVTLLGNVATPANCIISVTSGNCITADSYGRLRIGGFKIQTTTSGIGVAATNGGNLSITAGPMEYGACATAHIYAERNGILVSNQAYAITGGAPRHLQALSNAYMLMSGAVTLTGTPAFASEFVRGERHALIESVSTYAGAATGTRYNALTGGGINVFGAGVNYFPGSVAGAATAPGWYA